jgi:hypothetical protein
VVSRNVIPLMVAPPAVVVRHAAEADLLVWWPTIRHWLASIRRRQGPRASWLPEHVRAAVVDRHADDCEPVQPGGGRDVRVDGVR